MSNQFEKMQKLAFGKVVKSTPETLSEGTLKDKVKEIIHSTLGEAKKKKKKDEEPSDVAPQEDIDINVDAEEAPMPDETTTDDTLAPSESSDIDIDPKVKSVQDYLQKAYANAKELGDEKLMTQIGNTITMVVRNQVLGGQAVAESLEEILNEDDIFDESYSVSDEVYKRMDNLVNQPDYMDFINSATKIMNNLVNEGFEVKDVFYYLYTRLIADV